MALSFSNRDGGTDSPAKSNGDLQLDDREQAIALCLSQGLADHEIAKVLGKPGQQITPEIEACMAKIGLTAQQRTRLRPFQVSSR